MISTCNICHGSDLRAFARYRDLGLVSSDLRAVDWRGDLCQCQTCGAVQKMIDALWHDAVAGIYASYNPYPQGSVVEQLIFSADGGTAKPRTQIVLERLLSSHPFAKAGKFLDIGCGDGALLRNWGPQLEGWDLYGADVSPHQRERILAIPGVSAFFPTRPEEISIRFDLMSLTHVLEHLLDPAAVLKQWRACLTPGGGILVELPDVSRNIFDLVIMDHVTHFNRPSLNATLNRAGLANTITGDDWVPGELISLARPSAQEDLGPPGPESIVNEFTRIQAGIDWLVLLAQYGQEAARAENFGIFGTSVKGTWLQTILGRQGACFFVDEDPNRIGQSHLGLPILSPQSVPKGATVFMASSPAVAQRIEARLRHLNFEIRLPPQYV